MECNKARVQHASSYRRVFERKLPVIFQSMQFTFETVRKSTGRITAGNLKDQVLKLLRIWQSWSIYSDSFISSLVDIFLGTPINPPTTQTSTNISDDEDIDGVPIE